MRVATHADMSVPADECRRAMKGFGTNEALLVQTLVRVPAELTSALRSTYLQRHRRNLESDIKSETSGYFETTLVALVRGPLDNDVHTLHSALDGAGTNEAKLNDVLIGRSNADIRAIKQDYQSTYRQSLESAVRGDLSLKTEQMFMMILAGTRQEESSPVVPQNTDHDVAELHRATEARGVAQGADQLTVCSILTNRSDGQIRAIAQAYEHKYRVPLEKTIIKHFSGHMEQALVQCVRSGADRAMRDALLIEDAMAGAGTKDVLLLERIVRAHWDRRHLSNVKGAYKHRFGRELKQRGQGETSGWFEKSLVAVLESA